MKKILLSLVLSFVVFAQSSAMKDAPCPDHKSVIEILKKVPGFNEHFNKYFSAAEQTKLKELFKCRSENFAEIPSLYELIFPDKKNSTPEIFKEGLPLKFPQELITHLENKSLFTKIFMFCQAQYLRGHIDSLKVCSGNITISMLRKSVNSSYEACSKIAAGKCNPRKTGTIGDYLLFRRPIQTYNVVIEYLIKHYSFRDPRTGDRS